MHASQYGKKIKAIGENILWTTDRHDGALVHYITVYSPPNDSEMAEITLRHLKWFLTRIFFIDKDTLVVVAGDFNKVGMSKSEFLEQHFKHFKLTPAVGKQQATHKLGGHLDNYLTNIPVTKVELINGLDHISDHTLIQVTLRISEDIERTLPYKNFSFYSATDVRKALSNDPDIRALLKKPDSLKESLRSKMQDKVKTRTKVE